ncbi:NAD(P)-dependent oxidoreductase [Prevotella sp. E9-3]|uniref:NAD-dependent epimerase/dehydratase family protein n=1 Tax=Prevotella sp. E9-3 TaxID=2913621 RepID=UPI001EDA67B4|nr:NAD(P)-dependent oxidoreductase [Prevotella sp. E9-3]UKK47502.1 NAD(P)-dependent oxidoreductase [Prevotella sp. E9-3]
MKIAIIGANGMLSVALTKYFYGRPDTTVVVYGLDEPQGYTCDSFTKVNLVTQTLNYEDVAIADVVIYSSGAGVQAALSTPSLLMYQLNVSAPIAITLGLKKAGFKGIYVSFGSYMEIGVNEEEGKAFNEDEVVCSTLPVTNDYALSKRLYGRYMRDFKADFTTYHFILPNMFSEDDLKPGTRLVPYTLQYLQDYCAGKKPEAPKFSAGTQTRQFITLEEMIQTVDKSIMAHIPSGLYCVGGGEFLSIRNLIERLFKIYDVPCKEEYFGQSVRRDGDIRSLCLNGEKLKKALDYLPISTIEEIFRR